MGDRPPSQKPNYHSILGISKSASLSDICKAYKTLVKIWHPDKHPNKDEANAQFRNITEAYRVLSSKKREESAVPLYPEEPNTPKTPKDSSKFRNKDDEGFISSPTSLPRSGSRCTPLQSSYSRRSTTPTPSNSYGYIPKSTSGVFNPTSTSNHSAPGGDSPSLSRVGTRRSSSTPIIYSQSTARRKPQPIEKKLDCTLEDLWRGCVKKIKITRDVISETGLIVQEEEILKIKVKPGWKKGTKITFEGKGDERPGNLPADIIFIINEKRHPMFKREGDDLVLRVEVPLVQALTGCTITVPLLGGEQMTQTFDEILYPGYEKIIPGEGMPKSKEQGKRGDLRLKFLVKFPTELSDEQRSAVLSVLNECS